ncbi:hypothetical protein OOT33_05330 [Sphingobium sp. DEHP117]|uniref:hypothetical protein n=1 Tax=Sphingobium sp. DEHP117 TaxID=2993436 RepID=UPI0027D4F9B1|nr:hypothetical protein [Sphingobium sp. DEHP117]MDQ4419862.1 hypothetical protein [Sphingobium sp. DEHP117]
MPGTDGDGIEVGNVPLPELARRIVSEGRAYATTEIERQRVKALIIGSGARDMALLALAAIFLLFGVMTALVVGFVWMLAPLVGVAGALAITILGTLLIVALLLLAARACIRRAVRMAFGNEDSV